MKNRSIILTATLSLLVCGGLSSTARAAAGSAPVTVVNTATNPVPIVGTVAVAGDPARQAVQQELDLVGVGNTITIPLGKIFVLENVSFEFVSGGTLDNLQINVTDPLITGGQGTVEHFLLPPTNPTTAAFIRGSQALRLYAQPGTTLTVGYQVGGQSPIVFKVSLSGYFVNAQ